MSKLQVCEIFYSLQGESTYSGRPCIFIRLSGCNLRCSYCDTPNSWEDGKIIAVEDVLLEVQKYPSKLVEITGGEPLFQDESIELMKALHTAGYEILLETNGSIYLEDVPLYVIKIIDVKCPGSGFGTSFMKWNLKLLQPQDELKFVLTSYADYSFALKYIRDNDLDGRKILFSPVTSLLPASVLASWMLTDGVSAHLQIQLHRVLNLQ